MALSLDVILASGLTAPASYIRITNVSIISKTRASSSVSFFANADNPIPYQIVEKTFDYDIEGYNPLKQAYEYLKTLPEFADATDC